MRRIHCLVGLLTVEGESYAQCACGNRSYAEDEGQAFDLHDNHKRDAWERED